MYIEPSVAHCVVSLPDLFVNPETLEGSSLLAALGESPFSCTMEVRTVAASRQGSSEVGVRMWGSGTAVNTAANEGQRGRDKKDEQKAVKKGRYISIAF